MNTPRRRLTIGEYAAATQLTAKALRLYDEQGLIKPGRVDATSGYRYYDAEQVATGRLVRTLRDMNLSLTQIREVLDTPGGLQPAVLRDLLHDAERRLARERSAYQSAVLMLRSSSTECAVHIEEFTASTELVALFSLVTNRRSFIEHALQYRSRRVAELQARATAMRGDCTFALLEPLTDDDAQVELTIPLLDDARVTNLTTRRLPERRFASVSADRGAFSDGFTACTDALFDWFDRKGVHAVGHPEVMLRTIDDELHANVRWAFSESEHMRTLR